MVVPRSPSHHIRHSSRNFRLTILRRPSAGADSAGSAGSSRGADPALSADENAGDHRFARSGVNSPGWVPPLPVGYE